jgi:hypothetical protein
LNWNPSDNCWNDAIKHPQGRINSTDSCHQKKTWTVFWHEKSVTLLNFLRSWTTVRSDHCTEKLKNLNSHIHQSLWSTPPPPRHTHTCCYSMTVPEHTQVCTIEIITKFWLHHCCSQPTVLTSYHQIFICLVFWVKVWEDIISGMMRTYRMSCTSGCSRDGEKIVNACCCSRMEEDCWQTWTLYLKITKPSAILWKFHV